MSDDKSKERLYRLLFCLKPVPEGLTKDQIDILNMERAPDEKWGASDAAVMLSLAYPKDGSFSMFMIPVDGRPEAASKEHQHELSDDEVFKVWCLLAHRLQQSKTLGDGQKELCSIVHSYMRDALLRARGVLPS